MSQEIPITQTSNKEFENLHDIEKLSGTTVLEKKILAQQHKIPFLEENFFSIQASKAPPLPSSILRYTEGNLILQTKLKEKYNPELPHPSFIDSYLPKVIVWRGCNAKQLVKMLEYGSAGGIKANRKAIAPSQEKAKKQVGEQKSLPEFTISTNIAEQFGRGFFVVACQINFEYLTEGSFSEKGVVCLPEAPIKFLGWKYGPPLLGQ